MRILLPVALFAVAFIGAAVSSRGPDHAEWGRRFHVAMLVLTLPCAIYPLRESWSRIRRKKTAVFLTSIGALGMLAFTLLLSFTGFMIQRVPANAGSSLLRMKALHLVGFPLLLSLSLGLMAAVTVRLAQRCAAPREGPPTVSGPASGALPGGGSTAAGAGAPPPA